jgi:general secretion pathway protein K
MKALAKRLVRQRGTGILPVIHGRDAHATRSFARASLGNVRHRRGSALLIALWTIALLALLVLTFTFDIFLETKLTAYARSRRRTEYLSLSGISVAEMLLDRQRSVSGNETEDLTASDTWYPAALLLSRGSSATVTVPLGGGEIRLTITPEPGKRNVNQLSDEDWEGILKVGDIPQEYWPGLIDTFNDWKDPDSLPRSDGAETADYYGTLSKPYQTRNGPVDTVRELLLVKGFSEAVLSGGLLNPDSPKEQQISVSGIQDMLTTYGDGKVNVNAADRRVLMTLPGVDALVANAIIEERTSGIAGANNSSFKNEGDLMSRVPGLDAAIKPRVTTRSQYFRVTSVGVFGPVTRSIRAIVYFDGARLSVLQWREEP